MNVSKQAKHTTITRSDIVEYFFISFFFLLGILFFLLAGPAECLTVLQRNWKALFYSWCVFMMIFGRYDFRILICCRRHNHHWIWCWRDVIYFWSRPFCAWLEPNEFYIPVWLAKRIKTLGSIHIIQAKLKIHLNVLNESGFIFYFKLQVNVSKLYHR